MSATKNLIVSKLDRIDIYPLSLVWPFPWHNAICFNHPESALADPGKTSLQIFPPPSDENMCTPTPKKRTIDYRSFQILFRFASTNCTGYANKVTKLFLSAMCCHTAIEFRYLRYILKHWDGFIKKSDRKHDTADAISFFFCSVHCISISMIWSIPEEPHRFPMGAAC